MMKDDFINEIRDGQTQEEGIKKRWSGYNTREVDQYIEKLLGRLSNMEKVYQERYEEMRTSLLGMTRERDEKNQQIQALEQQLHEMPQDWEKYLEEQGRIAVPRQDYERFQGMDETYLEEAQRLKEEKEQLINELDDRKNVCLEAAELSRQLEEISIKLQIKTEEYQQLTIEMNNQIDRYEEQKTKLEAAELEILEQSDMLNQSQLQFTSLTTQYQLSQAMAEQLIKDKEHLEKDAAIQKQRQAAHQASLIHRYQGVLQSQQQCLKQLQESFVASVRCMESLSETGMRELPAEEAEGTDHYDGL